MIFILFVIFYGTGQQESKTEQELIPPPPPPPRPPDIESRVCIHKATLHKKVNCAPDAVIWAEQQLVAIPGWLLKYQNARLDQEGQLTSRKRPRSQIIKKNKAKRRTIYCEERGNNTVWRSKPSPSGNFGARTREFSEKPADLWKSGGFQKKVADFRKKSGGFEANSQVASLGGTLADFPKICLCRGCCFLG